MDKLHELILDRIVPTTIHSASNTLAQKLREMIINDDLPAEYRFPNENEFCEQLGIGRGTLREAYKVLESEGLIIRTKRGTFVNDIARNGTNLSFHTAIEVSEYRDLLEFRIMFEAELAYLAATRATDEEIAQIAEALKNMELHRDNLLLLSYHDMQFHMEVCNASHNKLLQSIMHMVHDTFEKSIYTAFHSETGQNIDQAFIYHRRILDAIIHHDAAAAEKSMREHVRVVYNRAFVNK